MPIYLDHAASSPLLPEAWEAMRPWFLDHPGNAASSHRYGSRARRALEDAREQIAGLLDAHSDEVIFTSGATEANNLAILGLTASPGTIVASPIEHPSVLEPIRHLTACGFALAPLPVTATGSIQPAPVPADTRLITIMLANHETGATQPVERFVGAAPLHCDAAAAAGKLPISFRHLGVTALTISAHKFHGPQGIGALLVRRDARLRPLLFGGHQQKGKRPGTEPVALAVGMATALAWSLRHLDEHRAKVLSLRRRLLVRLRAEAAPVVLNGPEEGGLPHTLNLSFPGCQADALLMRLDLAGVACSTGSACSSGSLLPSPVLVAMGVTDAVLRSAMRFSLSAQLTETDLDEAARHIIHCVNRLRHTDGDGSSRRESSELLDTNY